MKTLNLGLIVGAAALSFAAGAVVSQPQTNKPSTPAPAPAVADKDDKTDDLQEIRKMLDEQAATAEQHKLLESLVGDFKTEGRMYMDPNAAPLVSRGTGKGEWVLGKRFVKVETALGQNAGGKELASESLTIYGFDTRTKKYTVVAFDTMGTYWVSGEGDYDAAVKELRLTGAVTEQGQTMKFRWVVKMDDRRNTTSVMINVAGEEWMKAAETIQDRK